jgi:hypothetical protein
MRIFVSHGRTRHFHWTKLGGRLPPFGTENPTEFHPHRMISSYGIHGEQRYPKLRFFFWHGFVGYLCLLLPSVRAKEEPNRDIVDGRG